MSLPKQITYRDMLRPTTSCDRKAAAIRLQQHATELLLLSMFLSDHRELALRLVASHSLLRGEYQIAQLALDEAAAMSTKEARLLAEAEPQMTSAPGGLDW
jgi:hypothetical protein